MTIDKVPGKSFICRKRSLLKVSSQVRGSAPLVQIQCATKAASFAPVEITPNLNPASEAPKILLSVCILSSSPFHSLTFWAHRCGSPAPVGTATLTMNPRSTAPLNAKASSLVGRDLRAPRPRAAARWKRSPALYLSASHPREFKLENCSLFPRSAPFPGSSPFSNHFPQKHPTGGWIRRLHCPSSAGF